MDIKEAIEILGDRATWELRAMKKALTIRQFLNTEEENRRLEAVGIMLKNRKEEKVTKWLLK